MSYNLQERKWNVGDWVHTYVGWGVVKGITFDNGYYQHVEVIYPDGSSVMFSGNQLTEKR
jgi:hypothetical protein